LRETNSNESAVLLQCSHIKNRVLPKHRLPADIFSTRAENSSGKRNQKDSVDADHPSFNLLGHARRCVYKHAKEKKRRLRLLRKLRKRAVAKKAVAGISPESHVHKSDSDSTYTPTHCSHAQRNMSLVMRRDHKQSRLFCNRTLHFSNNLKCHQRVPLYATIVYTLPNQMISTSLQPQGSQSVRVYRSSTQRRKFATTLCRMAQEQLRAAKIRTVVEG